MADAGDIVDQPETSFADVYQSLMNQMKTTRSPMAMSFFRTQNYSVLWTTCLFAWSHL